MKSFNKILASFSLELAGSRNWLTKIDELILRARTNRLALRRDVGRDWENTCALEWSASLRSTVSNRMQILDFGGGNSPLCYLLANAGFDVTVLEIDPSAIDHIRRNAELLCPQGKIQGVLYRGLDWPLESSGFDAIVSLSVFEGIVPKLRPLFWAEAARCLKGNGRFLVSFDYGAGACKVGTPPTSLQEIQSEIVDASGLALVGDLPSVPAPAAMPVKLVMRHANGYDFFVTEYTFAMVELQKVHPHHGPTFTPRYSAMLEALRAAHIPEEFAIMDADGLIRQVLVRRLVEQPILDLQSKEVHFEILEPNQKHTVVAVCFSDVGTPFVRGAGDEYHEPHVVYACSLDELRELLFGIKGFWEPFYSGTFYPRGDIRLAMRLTDVFGSR